MQVPNENCHAQSTFQVYMTDYKCVYLRYFCFENTAVLYFQSGSNSAFARSLAGGHTTSTPYPGNTPMHMPSSGQLTLHTTDSSGISSIQTIHTGDPSPRTQTFAPRQAHSCNCRRAFCKYSVILYSNLILGLGRSLKTGTTTFCQLWPIFDVARCTSIHVHKPHLKSYPN